jgi:multiple sugar transport system substrate-binding protein
MSEQKSRREYIYTIGGLAAGAVIGGAAYALLAPPTPGGETTVTETSTKTETVTETVTSSTTETSTAVQPMTLRQTWFTDQHAEAWQPRFDLYMSQHPGVTIESVPAAGVSDYYRMQAQIAESKSPELDIMNLDVIWGVSFNTNAWSVNLKPYASEIKFDELVPAMVDSWTLGDRIGGHPYMADIGGMWYRKDIVEETEGITPPTNGWTWDEFVAMCLDFKDKYPDKYPLAIDMSLGEQIVCNFQEFLVGNGGQWFDDDWNVYLADTPAIEACQMMYDLVNTHAICHPETLTGGLDVARIHFTTTGDAIFHRNWCYVWGYNTNSTDPFYGKIWETLIPHFDDYPSVHCVGGWSWAVNVGTSHLDQALDYVKFLGSYENMKAVMLAGGHLGARTALYQDPDIIAVIPIAPAYYELYTRGTIRPKHTEYVALSEMLQAELSAAVSASKPVETAMNDAAAKIADYLGTQVIKR